MKIKVCGLKYADNIAAVTGLDPDYVGFIRYDRSPRYADDLPEEVLKQIPYTIKKTGVFVNEDAAVINELIDKYNLEAIQLHGSESPEFCARFKGRVEVLKAFGVDEQFNFQQLNNYVDHVDYFLFDTKTVAHGGSGQTFDWSVLDKYELDIPFFLSGGLSLDNIAEIKNIKHPAFYGVDLNSKFETEPGFKDIDKLKQAFEIVRGIKDI